MERAIRYRRIWEMARLTPLEGIFTQADILVSAAQEFFKWCDDNPRYQTQVVKHKMEWDTIQVELRRPYTLSGLCMHLGTTQSYLRQTKSDLMERYESGTIDTVGFEILAAIEWIYQIVFTDQIEGAATGQYNANIIARLNGLSDITSVANTVEPVLRIVTRDAATTENLNLLVSTL